MKKKKKDTIPELTLWKKCDLNLDVQMEKWGIFKQGTFLRHTEWTTN